MRQYGHGTECLGKGDREVMGFTFSIEDLDKALEHSSIKVHKKNENGELFSRIRVFDINNELYKITWYSNICYLRYNHLTIPFQYAKQSNTWPNNSKQNLQFYDGGDAVCCILKIEDY